MAPSLEGKVIVVTGASSGFGRGAAVKAGSEGANVVFAARRTDLIEEAANEVTVGGGRAMLSQPM